MPEHRTPPAGGACHEDTGLLSPVWAGTPVESLVDDRACLQAMLDAEVALTWAQNRCGHVPRSAARTVAATARSERFDLAGLAQRGREAANPIVPLVSDLTRAVAAVDPAAAEYVHRGSTSQDILDTGLMLLARRALSSIDADLARAAEAASGLASRYRDAPMAGRTLTQHAVPITFGLKAAGWLSLLLDARDRVRRLLTSGLPVQLGGAAGTLASYLELGLPPGERSPASDDRVATALLAAFAHETGLCEPVLPWHTQRTPVADLAWVLSFCAGALGKIAADVLSLARTETAEVLEPAADGRGASSAMPHKRNPVLATMVRAAAAQVPGYAAVLLQCMVAEDERPAGAWHAEWQPLRECLRLVGGAGTTAAQLLDGLVVDAGRMRDNLGITEGQVVSERVAASLGAVLGKVRAKAVLTAASQHANDEGVSLRRSLIEMPELAGMWTDVALDRLLDPARYLGASGLLVDRALQRYAGREAQGVVQISRTQHAASMPGASLSISTRSPTPT